MGVEKGVEARGSVMPQLLHECWRFGDDSLDLDLDRSGPGRRGRCSNISQ